jgi:hypothetical protein
MARTTKKDVGLVFFVLSSCLLFAVPAIAADEEAGESAGPPRPTPPAGDVVAPTAAAEAASTPVTLPPPPPPPPPGAVLFDPKIGVGAWIRIGGRIENPSAPDQLNDFFMDTLYLVAALRGQFTDWLKWTASLAAVHYTPPSSITLDAELPIPQAGIQDLIVKFEPHELFNIWVGRMLVPFDRANLSGPWFINYWMMRGVFPRVPGVVPPPYGIKSGSFGRDQGVAAWGQVAGGKFKYYAGAYGLDNQSVDAHPMVAGRLVLNLLDPEPGYFNQSAYHGERDILAFGVGGQYQKGGSVTVIPASEFGDLKNATVDFLFDKKLGSQAVTLDASAYFADRLQPLSRLYVVGLGYTSPPVGPGRLVPAVRAQIGTVPEDRAVLLDREFLQFDGYVSYVIKSHFAKIMAGAFWTRTRLRSAMPSDPSAYARGIQFGVQLIGL